LRSVAVIILLLVVSSLLTAPASAAEITINVEKEQVLARMVLSVHQNITVLPSQTSVISGTQDAGTLGNFSEAIRKLNPNAILSDLSLQLNSSNDWLNLTITMSLSGIIERRGDMSTVNMTWKAFDISADLRAGNLSYNLIGKKYLRPVFEYYTNASMHVGRPNATITGVSFLIGGNQSISGIEATNRVANASLLDFRPLSHPVEKWTRTYHLSNNTTTWRYAPIPLLADSIRIQELNVTRHITSDYGYSAEIIVPGLGRATGDTVLVDVGAGQKEWIMAGIVVLAVVFAVAAQLLFRARKKKLARMRRR
jgi:hypothetical protein